MKHKYATNDLYMNLIEATNRARKSTGKLIATNVSNGRFNVVEITKRKGGHCDVITMASGLTQSEAIEHLRQLSK